MRSSPRLQRPQLPPIAGIRLIPNDRRLVPKADKVHRNKNGLMFDHIVGGYQAELSVEEAERIGLISLCSDADLQKIALETAQDLASGAQSAIRWTKYALNNWLRVNGPLFDTSTALEMLGFTGAEAREGLASHIEKRRPSFPKDCPI